MRPGRLCRNVGTACSRRALVAAAAFGLGAGLIVVAKLTIPIAGTGIVTDPREVFTTIGAGLTGPVGGLLVGVLAALPEPGGLRLASLLAHVSGALWLGLAYRPLYARVPRVGWPVVWAALVVVYYVAFAVPGFVIGQRIFHPAVYAEAYGTGAPLWEAYRRLAVGARPEMAVTAIFTALVMLALPHSHRRPLW